MQTTIPTWGQPVAAEPRLAELLDEAKSWHGRAGADFCANEVWYGYRRHRPGIKPRLVKLVGWWAEGDAPILRSAAAYETAYTTVYYALPDCRCCGCAERSVA